MACAVSPSVSVWRALAQGAWRQGSAGERSHLLSREDCVPSAALHIQSFQPDF